MADTQTKAKSGKAVADRDATRSLGVNMPMMKGPLSFDPAVRAMIPGAI